MTADQLREKYLKFFASKGHAVISGASLVPENDPTVLFTTAGMHPLVPFLLGEPHPAGKRLTDVQKCVRTGDIEAVGDVRGRGFFVGVEFVRDRASREPFDPALGVSGRVGSAANALGLLLYPIGGNVDGTRGDALILAPPYNAPPEILDEIVVLTGRAIRTALGGA